jgi:hypothetical protein
VGTHAKLYVVIAMARPMTDSGNLFRVASSVSYFVGQTSRLAASVAEKLSHNRAAYAEQG